MTGRRRRPFDLGKDADLVLYNHDPLSAYAIVQKTLIDGRVYFDLQKDIADRAAHEKEKKDLIAKEKKAGEKKDADKKADEKKPGDKKPDEKKTEEKKPDDKSKPPQSEDVIGGGL